MSRSRILILVVVLIALVISGFFYFSSRPKQIVSQVKTILVSEVSAHNTKEDCWTTIDGGVYDLTKFISIHKGGDKILAACGVDATDYFTGRHPTIGRVHSQMAVKLLSGMKIGDLQK